MAKHAHVMVMDLGGQGRWWFRCEGCPARVEVVPSTAGDTVTASMRVRSPGAGGFDADELIVLGWLWIAGFLSFAESQLTWPRASRRRRRVRAA
jgi:hypothetical protein